MAAVFKGNDYLPLKFASVKIKPEALKSLYRSPGNKKTNWSYVKTMSCSGSHLGITINIKNTKFVKDLPMFKTLLL
jgi:hypothetical protein